MKEKTKFVIGSFFKSLINNDAAVEAGKRAPWWTAAIMFVLAVGLPLIPIATSTANRNGADLFASGSLDFDRKITEASLKLLEENKTFEIKDGDCFYKVNGTATDRTGDDAYEPIYRYESVTTDQGVTTKQYDFDVYYCSSEDTNVINEIINRTTAIQYAVGTQNKKSETDAEGTKYYTPSFLLVHKKGMHFTIYLHNDTKAGIGVAWTTDWNHTANGELLARITTNTEIAVADRVSTNRKYVTDVFNNFKAVTNETYLTVKGELLRNSLLIYAGVYVALIMLMGFMLWLLTRGKNNPFNYLRWWTTTKIAWWASFCPALLGMIGGFIFPQYAPFIFIIFLGLRIMWLSMKNLRPQY